MVRKGDIINDELVENPNGEFYMFDTVDELKAFIESYTVNDEDEELECKACSASNTEIEIRQNGGKCINCEMPWDYF